ncbi:hypothetical protein [uncultured Shewanella sp.]|uniref:hypothetical protein n=1 Tax=uncultured Shewanella sp. TaxID=173975 RepID=UPI00262299BA|nr:hypothetical protein [uncultured Shewanella sp.]
MINTEHVEKTHENVTELVIRLKLRIECLERQLERSVVSSTSSSSGFKLTRDELKMLHEQF